MSDISKAQMSKLSVEQEKVIDEQLSILENAAVVIDGMKKMGIDTTAHGAIILPLRDLVANMKRNFGNG